MRISSLISKKLGISVKQIDTTIQLLNEGATVPFIARYRKEMTGGLSDDQLRDLYDDFHYFTELDSRQQTILNSIEEQGKLTDELKKTILETVNKTELEDLYLPYKQKRRTKAQIAKEAGLELLAEKLLQDVNCDSRVAASEFINAEKGIETIEAALEGAQHILAEQFSEHAELLKKLREIFWKFAVIKSEVSPDKLETGNKFSDYFDFQETILKIPAHRFLALFRGRQEGFLRLKVAFPSDQFIDDCCQLIAESFSIPSPLPKEHWLSKTILWTWKIKLHLKMELEVMIELKNRADSESIQVFATNLKNLMMAAPAGNHVVLGLDPGFRTGVKTVIVDGTGKLLTQTVIFPHAPQKQWDQALVTLSKLCVAMNVTLISIGNGTASRETDQLAEELIKKNPQLKLSKIVVSEAGASVYSASALASKEFPDLDVSYRGAVSIARRLQDPLAELVKIDPKSIGVGQYQHDVNQLKLNQSLSATVEDCVNAVGADVNTASVPLLSSISGLNESVANQIVQYRETHGRFKTRDAIKLVPRLGDKTFEQAAGFLRIIGGGNCLDASAVHPESYLIVEDIAKKTGKTLDQLIGNSDLINTLNPKDFVTIQAGLPTIQDIFSELKKPGRDPRPEFKMAKFTTGVNEISDLKLGMVLEGVVTNVANFGAFVDIGVHQDGLVHLSQLADHYVKEAQKEVSVGQIVMVRVLEIDAPRKRISLTMKKDEAAPCKKQETIVPSKKTIAKRIEKQKVESAFGACLKDALLR
ncbi:MAG: Tex family protein [Gammaproteobacteria bacterium]|nr:Tex family protein [Gammaproteobacteria bacterium]